MPPRGAVPISNALRRNNGAPKLANTHGKLRGRHTNRIKDMRKQQKQDKTEGNPADAIYAEIVAYLEAKKSLENVDLRFVRTCANIAARIEKYEREILKSGEVETYPNGAVAPSAAYKILVTERQEFARYCRALGITPAGRDALTGFAAIHKPTTSKLRSLMNKKQAK